MQKGLLYSFIVTVLLHTAVTGQNPASTPRTSVPDINGMAISLVKPAFPETAVAAQADGSAVSLFVAVSENGNVISAKC